MPGEGIVAFCSFWLVLDEVHINNLAVRGDFRGRGVGTALLEHVHSGRRAPGAERATLEVRRSNAPARRLYERLGFEVAATRPNYYVSPPEDALILWRGALNVRHDRQLERAVRLCYGSALMSPTIPHKGGRACTPRMSRS